MAAEPRARRLSVVLFSRILIIQEHMWQETTRSERLGALRWRPDTRKPNLPCYKVVTQTRLDSRFHVETIASQSCQISTTCQYRPALIPLNPVPRYAAEDSSNGKAPPRRTPSLPHPISISSAYGRCSR